MKSVDFKYYGGTEKINISTNLSLKDWHIVSNPCEWITHTVNPTSILITAKPNSFYKDRTHSVIISGKNNKKETIEIRQEGYRNLLVDLSAYVIIPSNYFIKNNTFDLPIRVYGGSGNFITDSQISKKIDKVNDKSAFYDDYVLHIDKGMSGEYTFTHQDRIGFSNYCRDKGYVFDEKQLVKRIVIKNMDNEILNGFASFSYYGKKYINELPSPIIVNNEFPTILKTEETVSFGEDWKVSTEKNYEIEASADWVETTYSPTEHCFYLKAKYPNNVSDRTCFLTIRSNKNRDLVYKSLLVQKVQESEV